MSQYFVQQGLTILFHPFGYAKTLIQLGHEPLQPTLRKTWFVFGKDQLYYPSVFPYMKHIKSIDGFFGLYRGLAPKLLGGIVGNVARLHAQNHLRSVTSNFQEENEEGEEDELIKWLKTYFIESTQEALSNCIGAIVSQPFHVITIRTMAQFVGRETAYDSIWSSCKEIYNNEGILGFFSGIIPRLIGEVITVYATNLLIQLMKKYLVQDKEMQGYTGSICGVILTDVEPWLRKKLIRMLVAQYTYRFALIGNVMAVNGSGLAVSGLPYMEPYKNWQDCFRTLKQQGQLGRGSSYFRRLYRGPVIMTETGPVQAGVSQWH